jgi:hypothetical protein
LQRAAHPAIPWSMQSTPSHELSVDFKQQDGKVAYLWNGRA